MSHHYQEKGAEREEEMDARGGRYGVVTLRVIVPPRLNDFIPLLSPITEIGLLNFLQGYEPIISHVVVVHAAEFANRMGENSLKVWAEYSMGAV